MADGKEPEDEFPGQAAEIEDFLKELKESEKGSKLSVFRCVVYARRFCTSRFLISVYV